jgi:hypothetical protein
MAKSYGIAPTSRKGGKNLGQQSKLWRRYSPLCQASNRVMWVGQHSRLSVAYPNNNGTMLTMKRGKEDMSNCDVRHIMEDSKHRMWVSTDNEGIIRVEGNVYKPTSLRYHFYCADAGNLPINDATACFEDSYHRIWAVSNSGGLFLYEPGSDRFVSVNARYNIPGDRIFSICEDSRGNLWMTTDNALLRLTLGPSPQLRTFGEGDGLTDLLFYPNVSLRHGDTLFFARQTGLFYFSSRDIRSNVASKPSKIVVTDILLDEESIYPANGELNQKVSDETPHLHPTHRRTCRYKQGERSLCPAHLHLAQSYTLCLQTRRLRQRLALPEWAIAPCHL